MSLADPLPDGIWTIELGVSSARPYTLDGYRRYQVVARDSVEARLIACQMAACTAMPVTRGDVVGVEF